MYESKKTQPNLALHQFLQENIEALQGIIQSYVLRSGLVQGEAVQNMVMEVLNEASVEVLAHAEKFARAQQPRAWFLGVAVNVIKRKRRALAQYSQHEFIASKLATLRETEGESDFFDHISGLTHPGPENEIETREQVAEMLSLVSPEDRHLLQLAFVQDLDTYSLARALNVQPGTARVRLHRALQRLRLAWQKYVQQKQEGGHYA
jgi:RNA polymerase sigma factor (sigma-70 family)